MMHISLALKDGPTTNTAHPAAACALIWQTKSKQWKGS